MRAISPTKTCSKCKSTMLFLEFCKNKWRKDGLNSECKKCTQERILLYRKNNQEKIKEAQSKYYAENAVRLRLAKVDYCKKNAERISASYAIWRHENPDKSRLATENWVKNNPSKLRTTQAAYRLNNSERCKSATAKWHKENPEANRLYGQNYRARKRENGGTLSKGISAKLLKLQKGKCACCSNPLGDDYHLDHIMPIKLGGTNTDDNIQLLRAVCNSQKNAKHPIDFMQSKGFLL